LSAHAVFCFFFFQAEDGIRDRNVTGVQTCALPISLRCSRTNCAGLPAYASDSSTPCPPVQASAPVPRFQNAPRASTCGCSVPVRSEERRVGKECRSRGSRGQRHKETRSEERTRTGR